MGYLFFLRKSVIEEVKCDIKSYLLFKNPLCGSGDDTRYVYGGDQAKKEMQTR